jgi:hypothetical protein
LHPKVLLLLLSGGGAASGGFMMPSTCKHTLDMLHIAAATMTAELH